MYRYIPQGSKLGPPKIVFPFTKKLQNRVSRFFLLNYQCYLFQIIISVICFWSVSNYSMIPTASNLVADNMYAAIFVMSNYTSLWTEIRKKSPSFSRIWLFCQRLTTFRVRIFGPIKKGGSNHWKHTYFFFYLKWIDRAVTVLSGTGSGSH